MRRGHYHTARNSGSAINKACGSACGSPKMKSQAMGCGAAKRPPIASSRRELAIDYSNFFYRASEREFWPPALGLSDPECERCVPKTGVDPHRFKKVALKCRTVLRATFY